MNLNASHRSYRVAFGVASVSGMPEDHNRDIGRGGREGGRKRLGYQYDDANDTTRCVDDLGEIVASRRRASPPTDLLQRFRLGLGDAPDRQGF